MPEDSPLRSVMSAFYDKNDKNATSAIQWNLPEQAENPMARSKKRDTTGDLRLQYAGSTPLTRQQVVRAVSQLLAADVDEALRAAYPEAIPRSIKLSVRGTLERRLEQLFIQDAEGQTTPAATLPIENLKPADVTGQRKVEMSIASLYRAVDALRFYCVVPVGQSNGRAFPAWQFVPPVPEVLPDVLRALEGSVRSEIHAFLVTALDELNELSPAEVLAGMPFEGRAALEASQRRLLELPSAERKRRVVEQVTSRENE
jgi:hypothetical protein